MKIGQAEFNASEQLKTGVNLDNELKSSAPVFTDECLYILGLPISANAKRTLTVSEFEKRVRRITLSLNSCPLLFNLISKHMEPVLELARHITCIAQLTRVKWWTCP